MARKKFITINGVDFQLKESKLMQDLQTAVITNVIGTSKTLDDCYNRPSAMKKAIYKSWMEWAENVSGLYSFGIRSYNTNIFTLQGYIVFDENKYGVVNITPSHDWIFVKDLSQF